MKQIFILFCLFILPLAAAAQHDHDQHGHSEQGHGEHGHDQQAHDGHEKHDVHQKGMSHSFEDAEKWSKRFDDPERAAWQKPDEVVALMEIKEGMSIADIGAGTGYFLGPLSAAAGEGKVFGLDVEPDMVEFMNQRIEREGWANASARQIPYDSPELEEGSVDRILIVDTWHHIDDRASYSAKLLKALKPEGRIYIVDFTMDSPEGPPPQHRLAPEAVIAELEAGGLHAEMIEETLPRQFIVVARR